MDFMDFINFQLISMPRFDGTGPLGKGPRTGRGFGPCADDESNQINSDLNKILEKLESIEKRLEKVENK